MILPSTMDEKFDEVCCTIRACLNSTKKQLSLSELCHDYKLVVGEAVPYQSLGYRSLEALLRAVPNLKISGSGNDIFVDVRPDEKTIHIANLVRGQKASKKKSKKKSTYGRIYRSAPAPPRRPFNDVSQRRKPSPPLGRNASNGNYYTRSNSNDHYISRSNNNDHYTSRTNDNYKSRTNSNDNFKSRTNNDYYTSRPSNNDHYASRTNTSYHSAPRRDPPHQYQKKPATPPISISSDDDFSEEKIRSRYQSSKPSAYNFSDPSEEGSDYDDFLEINNLNNEMNGLKVTLGSERQVSINKQKFRGYQSTTSNDDDYEYSSMRANSKSNRYIKAYSDSYEDDNDGYPSLCSSSENSSTSDHLDSAIQVSRLSASIRAKAYDTKQSRPPQQIRVQAGRGCRTETKRQYEYSTNFQSDTKSGNIRVTLPNGSGRARAVAFLLR